MLSSQSHARQSVIMAPQGGRAVKARSPVGLILFPFLGYLELLVGLEPNIYAVKERYPNL